MTSSFYDLFDQMMRAGELRFVYYEQGESDCQFTGRLLPTGTILLIPPDLPPP